MSGSVNASDFMSSFQASSNLVCAATGRVADPLSHVRQTLALAPAGSAASSGGGTAVAAAPRNSAAF